MNYDFINAIVMADFHHGAIPVDRYRKELYQWLLPSLQKVSNSLKINYVVIAGDYFDRKMEMTSPATQLAFQFLYDLCLMCYEINAPLHILSGTWSHDHDQLNVVESVTRMYKLKNGLPMVRVYRQPVLVEIKSNYNAWMVPETYPVDQNQYIKSLLSKKAQTMHFHGRWDFASFREELLQSEKPHRSAPVHKTEDFNNTIAGPITGGHIHTGDHNDKVFYTRSISRWHYGEEASKGYLVTSHLANTRNFKIWHVDNSMAMQYITIAVQPGQEEKTFKYAKSLKEKGHHVKLKPVDSGSYQILRQASNEDSFIKVEFDKKNASLYNVVTQHSDMQSPYQAALQNPDPIHSIIEVDRIMNQPAQPLQYEFIARTIGVDSNT